MQQDSSEVQERVDKNNSGEEKEDSEEEEGNRVDSEEAQDELPLLLL